MQKILFMALMASFCLFNMGPLEARGAGGHGGVGGGHGGFGDRGAGFRGDGEGLYHDDRFYQDQRRDLEDQELNSFDDVDNYDGIDVDDNFPDNEVPDEAEAIYEYNQ